MQEDLAARGFLVHRRVRQDGVRDASLRQFDQLRNGVGLGNDAEFGALLLLIVVQQAPQAVLAAGQYQRQFGERVQIHGRQRM